MDMTDTEIEELQSGFTTAVRQVLPDIMPTIVDVGLAAAGQRASTGRMVSGSGLLSDIPTETITSERTRRVVGDVLPARLEEMLTALTGTGAGPILSGMNALNRELTASDDLVRGVEAAIDRAAAAQLDRTDIVRGLFGAEFRISTNDANAKIFKDKTAALKDIALRFRLDLKGAAPASGPLPSVRALPTEAQGTALQIVLNSAGRLASSGLNDINEELSRQFNMVQDIRRVPTFSSNPKLLRRTENQIAKRIKGVYMGGVQRLQEAEDEITALLQPLGFEGSFRFDDFDDDMAEALAKIPLQ